MLHRFCANVLRHLFRRGIASHGNSQWYLCRVCGSVVRRETK